VDQVKTIKQPKNPYFGALVHTSIEPSCDAEDMPDMLECRSAEYHVDNLRDNIPAPSYKATRPAGKSGKRGK
jgi:hypothetical protein